MKTGIVIVFAGICLATVAAGAWYLSNSPEIEPQPGIAFSAEGNVTQNNPGQKPNVWYLIYEKPGSPGLSAELDLSAVSDINLEQGDRVLVTGTLNETTVLVNSITIVSAEATTNIKLYFYNPDLDQGPGGVQCSKDGLVAVDRAIPETMTPLTDAINLLLRGELSSEESATGITTEFPLDGTSLVSATIKDGVATLTLNDPQNKTIGGSCRTAILWAQIEATAQQFPTVTSVRFMPEELFQP